MAFLEKCKERFWGDSPLEVTIIKRNTFNIGTQWKEVA
jgi:hypothetical protein